MGVSGKVKVIIIILITLVVLFNFNNSVTFIRTPLNPNISASLKVLFGYSMARKVKVAKFEKTQKTYIKTIQICCLAKNGGKKGRRKSSQIWEKNPKQHQNNPKLLFGYLFFEDKAGWPFDQFRCIAIFGRNDCGARLFNSFSIGLKGLTVFKKRIFLLLGVIVLPLNPRANSQILHQGQILPSSLG